MTTSVVVFTRDLRVHDHPALHAACRAADTVVPLFVLDDALLGAGSTAPNRLHYLHDALEDLDRALALLGGALVLRRGSWVTEVMRTVTATRADTVHVSYDVTDYAHRRLDRLARELAARRAALHRHDGITVVPPGSVQPTGRDHYGVFTPYFRRWKEEPWRAPLRPPRSIALPRGFRPGARSQLDALLGRPATAIVLPPGGATAGRHRLRRWLDRGLSGFAHCRDDLAADATSRLGPDLHFGCLSALEVATRAREHDQDGEFLRQLCWRDFFHQVLDARPETAWDDYRPTGVAWRRDRRSLAAWRDGRTGFPVVDAALRQLQAEGFMPNRARMITASFLTKDLDLDWRHGARHFLAHLVDGDVANNNLSWQWVAGTGTDRSPHRILNPTVQSGRFDPGGDYIRRWVPELASLPAPAIHDPSPAERAARRYPPVLVDHRDAVAAYRARRR